MPVFYFLRYNLEDGNFYHLNNCKVEHIKIMKKAVIASTIIASTLLGTTSINVEPTFADYNKNDSYHDLEVENTLKNFQRYNRLTPHSTASSLTVDAIHDKQRQRTVYAYVIESSSSGTFSVFPIPIKIDANASQVQALKAVFYYIIFRFKDFSYNGNDYLNSIPQGTVLNSVSISGDAVYIDFSREAISQEGKLGGESEILPILQIIYNATTLNPNAKVWFSIDGLLLESYGQRGELNQPLTRNSI